jgi:hypothetical protein
MPTVRAIGGAAFAGCEQLMDVEFGNQLETIQKVAFHGCTNLQRIVIPLKDNMFTFDTYRQRCTQFDFCGNLKSVDVVGGIHKTIASLLLESWRDKMNQEIDRINQDLPDTHVNRKAGAIQEWIRSVINRMEHYKAEHN